MKADYKKIYQAAMELAGTYEVKSPYHKNKKMLPFVITGGVTFDDNYPIEVRTVEYRGWTKHDICTGYSIQSIKDMIKSNIITKTI